MDKKPEGVWTRDPDRILEVALSHTVWEPEFADRLVERIGEWLKDKPRQRDRLRELLKADKASRQSLPLIEYAAILARHKHLQQVEGLTPGKATERLAEVLHKSTKTIEHRLTEARRLLDTGALEEWASSLR